MGANNFAYVTGNAPDLSHRRLIAHGAYGEIKNVATEQVFARKLVRAFGDTKWEEVENEFRAIEILCIKSQHSNIVKVFDHGKVPIYQSYYYIDMELCDFSLETYIEELRKERVEKKASNKEKGVPPILMTQPLDILKDIANGIAFIHDKGEIHRDLKPKNILYSVRDKAWKITDFGLTAEGTSRRAHTTKYSRGSTSYRAPELLKEAASYTNKVDIWALGCIFHDVIYLEKAFKGDYQVLSYESPKNLILPVNSKTICDELALAQLKSTFLDMLKKEPEKRPSAAEILERLESINSDTFTIRFSVYSSFLRVSRLLQLVLTRSVERIPLVLLLAILFLVLGAVVCVTALFWGGVFAASMELFFSHVCKIVFDESARGEVGSQWLSYESCSMIREFNRVILDLWDRSNGSGIWR